MNRPFFNPPYRHWGPIAQRIAEERKKQDAARRAAQRTLDGIDFDALRRRVRETLNAKCKPPRWT